MELFRTLDGSFTIRHDQNSPLFSSSQGAKSEKQYIFVDQGFNFLDKEEINILEIGFGSGLNCFLTLMASKNKKIYYHTLEKYIVPLELAQKLNYHSNQDEKELFLKLHQAPWNTPNKITENFTLEKTNIDLIDYIKKYDEQSYNLIYFDAFAPNDDNQLWTLEVFNYIYNVCQKDAILLTYCSKGIVKQNLRDAGFLVKRIPGPLNKRHILRCQKL